MSSDRQNFFGLADDKLYYDEKRKRFVNTANAPGYVHRQYYQGHFKDVSFKFKVSDDLRITLAFDTKFFFTLYIATP